MRVAKNIELEQLKKHGFKYGTRDKFIYKTKTGTAEARIYVDLLPCNNRNNKLYIESDSHSISDKIINKIYDLTKEGLIEKE